MTNRNLFITVMLLFLLPFCMGLGKSPEEKEQDIHVSEEVKIDREQDRDKEQDKKDDTKAKTEAALKAGAEERQDDESEKVEEQKMQDMAEAAQDEDKAATPDEKELEELMLTEDEALFGDEERYYTRKGRIDPFEPFLRRQESEGEQEEEEELQRRKPQTPLERISLSQLKLTAILRIPGEDRAMAMVEDKDGKGYVVRAGTYIGENGGQIDEILRDRIIIREKYKDVYGKIAEREIEKKIQNQSGE